jgi:DoxX-like family
MPPETPEAPVSTRALRTGRVLSGIAILFLAFDASVKLLKPPFAVDATTQLGYPESLIVPLGVIQAVCLIVYAIPRTSVLGAVLWTAYLGGAVATQVRVANPLLSHTLVPVYVAAVLWLGLWLRDVRLRAILPTRR